VTREQRWVRLRLGFFASKEAAEEARAQLVERFPDSFVVTVAGEERVASRETAIARPRADRAVTAADTSEETVAALTRVQQDRADRWIQEAREALTSGDLARAINRLTAIIALPSNEYTREARELLGLARERNGQLAHAKAEYEAYLALYPDDEGAARVRQRLDTLVTLKARPKDGLRDAKRARSRYQSDVVGSLASTYYRIESERDDALMIDPVLESSIFTDIYLSAYMRGPRFRGRSLAAGSHRHSFRDPGRDDFRFSSLELEVEDEELRVAANLGRQSQSGGGVLGRFDGAALGYEFRDGWTVRGVGGFPLESSYQTSVQTRRYFVGGALEARDLFDSLRVELFAIGQKADGLIDRVAVGGEVQYWNDPVNVTSYLDYDVYFDSLNIAYLVGSWRATSATTLNALFDYRNSPILTASSAVQGQLVRHVGDLLSTYDEGEIRDLARDRTARSKTVTLGASHRFTDRVQLSGDVSGMLYSGTATSGGVIGMDSLGWEFNYFAQLIVSSLFMDDDIETVGFRYFEGNTRDVASLLLLSRLNVTPGRSLRVYPRLTINLDRQEIGTNLLSVVPSVRLDYRIWKLSLDLEGGLNWTTPLRQSSQTLIDPHRLEYLLRAGLRLDF
jgi:tetratricopeptide (TPR) repeat protein